MKYRETIQNDKGIFYYLNAIDALPFENELYPYLDLDICFTWNNGEGILPKYLVDEIDENGVEETYSKLARVLKIKYSNKWKQLYQAFKEEYPLLLSTLETIDEMIEDTGNDLNQVSAYDSEEMVADSGTQKTGNKKRTYERKTIRPDMIRNIERLQDSIIYDTIFIDIKQNIILKIY